MHFSKQFIVAAVLGLAFGSLCEAQEKPAPLKVGDKVTEFKLESMNDEMVESGKQFGDEGRPAILLFSRANW